MGRDFVYAIVRNIGDIDPPSGALGEIHRIDADTIADDCFQCGQPPNNRCVDLGRAAAKYNLGSFRSGNNFIFGRSSGFG